MTVTYLEQYRERSNAPEQATREALEAVQELFDEYVTFPSQEARDATVLWALHTHVFRAFESTPRLSVRSKDPASGKSRVLEVLEHLVPNCLNAVYMTPGVMWRLIESSSPTIFLDEADTIFGKNGSGSAHRYLRGIINAGHRNGATVPRCVGSEDVKEFHVFAPVAMAGLGRLPETIATRSVEVVMRKRRKGDPPIKPFRLRVAAPRLANLARTLEEWARITFRELEFSLPELPVKDRNADVWEPLVAIGDLAGPEWSERARKACVKLTEESSKRPVSPGQQLLIDLQRVWGDDDAHFTHEILAALYSLDNSPWDYESMDSRKLSRLLNEYGVSPSMLRRGKEVARGYKRADMVGAFRRYLPEK